jgi:hypothetical protein
MKPLKGLHMNSVAKAWHIQCPKICPSNTTNCKKWKKGDRASGWGCELGRGLGTWVRTLSHHRHCPQKGSWPSCETPRVLCLAFFFVFFPRPLLLHHRPPASCVHREADNEIAAPLPSHNPNNQCSRYEILLCFRRRNASASLFGFLPAL